MHVSRSTQIPDDMVQSPYYTVVSAEQQWALPNFKELWHFRELLLALAIRDIRVRYKQTALGVFWIILQPLLASSVFALLLGQLAKLPSDGQPYLLFVYVGLVPWTLFSSSGTRASMSLMNSRGLISKVYFPRLTLPISGVLAGQVDFGVNLIMTLILLIVFGVPFTWKFIALGFYFLLTMLLALGLGMIVAALSVYYRDLQYALPFILQIMIYSAPLVYSESLIPREFLPLYQLNPITGIANGVRWALLGSPEIFPLISTLSAVVFSVLLFLVGAVLFRRAELNSTDVL